MKKTVILFVSLSVVASAINYLAYPMLGRILPSSQYIEITLALSLFTQITTFLSSINAITIGLTKDGKDDPATITHQLQSALYKIFILLIILFLVVSPFVFTFIKIPVVFGLPIAFMMLAALPLTIMSGYLNGKQLMVKLGILTVISAGFQFMFGVVVATLSGNGLLTLFSMAVAQFCAITCIYLAFRKDKLPNPLPSLKAARTVLSKDIIAYAVVASVAIMLVNLLQVADLILITNHKNSDARFYTDLYVVSRILFFGGMIFIWPFLSELNTKNLHANRKPFYKLLAIFGGIIVAMIIPLGLFGAQLVHLVFGSTYTADSVLLIGGLSLLFKLFLLIATAVTLYLMVVRSYTAIIYSLILCAAIALYGLVASRTSAFQTILSLTIIAGIGAIIGIAFLLAGTRKRPSAT